MRKYIYGHHILSATKILRFMAFRLQLESIHFKNSDLNNKTIVSDRFSYKTNLKSLNVCLFFLFIFCNIELQQIYPLQIMKV